LVNTTEVAVELGHVGIMEDGFTGIVVELVEIIEWSDLERLRDITMLQVESDLSFDQIDLRCGSTFRDVRPWVVFAWASTSGESLSGKVR
jgi:hypothetical protein